MIFIHLHVHTQYSFDSMASIEGLFARAEELGMPALAITDSGTMSGVNDFLNCAASHPAVKPIVGCDLGIIHDDGRIDLVTLLAKNKTGYRNLVRIEVESRSNEKLPTSVVSHEFIVKHKKGLICIGSGVALDIFWYKDVFADDFYWEVQKCSTDNPGCKEIFRQAKSYGVKVVATNDVFFVRKEDGPAYDPSRQGSAYQEYLKSGEEMLALFPDHPEALVNTLDVAAKVERYYN